MEGSAQRGQGNRAEERRTPEEAVAGRDGLTLRAFLVGLFLCATLGIGLTYNRMVVQGPFMGSYYMDRGVLFVFFCLVLVVNPLLASLKRRYALGRGELLAIYAMVPVFDAGMGDGQGAAGVYDRGDLLCFAGDAPP